MQRILVLLISHHKIIDSNSYTSHCNNNRVMSCSIIVLHTNVFGFVYCAIYSSSIQKLLYNYHHDNKNCFIFIMIKFVTVRAKTSLVHTSNSITLTAHNNF